MGNYGLIIFDCDGTLVDTEAIAMAAHVEVFQEFGINQYDVNYIFENWTGWTFSDVAIAAEKETGIKLSDEAGKIYVQKCQEKYKESLKPNLDILNFVKYCDDNIKICVASNGQRDNIFASLSQCGFIPEFFEDNNIFSKIQVKKGKPSPDLFLFAADKMDVDPVRCLVIEDSAPGAVGAIAAGMEVWGFIGTSHDRKTSEARLIEAGATQIFDDFIHMRERLKL